MKVAIILFVFSAIFVSANGLKVFGFLPFCSKSHYAIGSSIIESLHEAGHEITVVSPYSQKKPLKNYREINTADILAEFDKQMSAFSMFEFDMHPIISVFLMYTFEQESIEMYMEHHEIQKLMKSNEKYDVCILETFASDAFVGLVDHFNCTLISYLTFGAVVWADMMTGNVSPYPYVPHPYLTYTDNMTFLQRLYNTFLFHLDELTYRFYHVPTQRKLYNKYFPNAKKSFDEMWKSSSIVFINNHISSSSAKPYLPNQIEIGGIHVKPAKPLPKDIQKFLDSASEEGAILFSMGSVIQAVQWPEEKRQAFVKAFGKLKQKVLWKYENETLPNKPDNVMISSWIPQRDILAHPNVKLFITHGGLLGTSEAVTEGVPVIGIPVFGDQKMNIARAIGAGYGLQVPLEEISVETISAAINEMLSNPKYKENAKLISSRYTDRPMTPKETVVYWTEYAVRHKGATHLQAAGNHLSFIQFHLIDVYLIFALIGLLNFYIDYLLLKFIIRKFFKKSSVKQKKQ